VARLGQFCVRIIEGRDRVGGRVHTRSLRGNLVDMGAAFVHGRHLHISFYLFDAGGFLCEDVTRTMATPCLSS
jgi:phytoene dehydrogenase-like protein